MEGRLLFKDCAIFGAGGGLETGRAVLVEGAVIVQVAPDEALPALPGDWVVPCGGRALLPGQVDCHAHRINAQRWPALGDVPVDAWDRARGLTPEAVGALAGLAFAQALRQGVTCVSEQLVCPEHVEEGLFAAARAAERVGLRLILGHGTAAREGAPSPERQRDQNLAFLAALKPGSLVRGALGLWTEAGLDAGFIAELGRQAHALGATFHRPLPSGGAEPLTPGAVVHVDRALPGPELALLEQADAFVAVSAPGAVGSALLPCLRVGLATAGRGPLAFEETFGGGVRGASLVEQRFQTPSGQVAEGRLADLVLYDAVPSGALPAADAALRAREAPVAWVVVDGRVVVREGQLLGADFLALARAAAHVSAGGRG